MGTIKEIIKTEFGGTQFKATAWSDNKGTGEVSIDAKDWTPIIGNVKTSKCDSMCPFCGGEIIILSGYKTEWDAYKFYCLRCGIESTDYASARQAEYASKKRVNHPDQNRVAP